MNTRENATETCSVLWLVLCGVNSVNVSRSRVCSQPFSSFRQHEANWSQKNDCAQPKQSKIFRHSVGELGVTAALVGRTVLPRICFGLTDGKSSGKERVTKNDEQVMVRGKFEKAGENRTRKGQWKSKFECEMCQTESTGSCVENHHMQQAGDVRLEPRGPGLLRST